MALFYHQIGKKKKKAQTRSWRLDLKGFQVPENAASQTVGSLKWNVNGNWNIAVILIYLLQYS